MRYYFVPQDQNVWSHSEQVAVLREYSDGAHRAASRRTESIARGRYPSERV